MNNGNWIYVYVSKRHCTRINVIIPWRPLHASCKVSKYLEQISHMFNFLNSTQPLSSRYWSISPEYTYTWGSCGVAVKRVYSHELKYVSCSCQSQLSQTSPDCWKWQFRLVMSRFLKHNASCFTVWLNLSWRPPLPLGFRDRFLELYESLFSLAHPQHIKLLY